MQKILLSIFCLLGLFLAREVPAQGISSDTEIRALLTKSEQEGNTGNYEKALAAAYAALTIAEKGANDSLHGACLNQLGKYYKVVGQFDRAIELHEKALRICRERNDSACMAGTYNNLGNAWSKKQNRQKAMEFYEQAFGIAEKAGRLKTLSAVSNNIANIYKEEKNYDKALLLYSRALQLSVKIGDRHGEAFYENNIGALYQIMGDPERALPHQRKALAMARQIKENVLLVNTLSQLSRTHKAMGRHDSALFFLEEYTDVVEKVFSENSSRQINEMQTKYETEKKEQEIEHLKKEKESEQLIRYFLAGGIVILLLLAFTIFNRYRVKNRANEKLSVAYQIIEEKNRSITDSIKYARKIQQSLLPTQKYIQRSMERLRNKKS